MMTFPNITVWKAAIFAGGGILPVEGKSVFAPKIAALPSVWRGAAFDLCQAARIFAPQIVVFTRPTAAGGSRELPRTRIHLAALIFRTQPMRHARANAGSRSLEPLVNNTCSLMQRCVSDTRARVTKGESGSPPGRVLV